MLPSGTGIVQAAPAVQAESALGTHLRYIVKESLRLHSPTACCNCLSGVSIAESLLTFFVVTTGGFAPAPYGYPKSSCGPGPVRKVQVFSFGEPGAMNEFVSAFTNSTHWYSLAVWLAGRPD